MHYINLFVAYKYKFLFFTKQKMDELTYELEETVDALTPDSLEGLTPDANSLWMWYEEMLNASEMSTSTIVTSCILLVWTIICRWKMFQKAGLPGWGAIIPFYNIYLRFKMAGMWGWWVLSLLFPPLFLIVLIVSYFKVPVRFGKHWAWGFGLWFLNPIFIGILAFDKSTYTAK